MTAASPGVAGGLGATGGPVWARLEIGGPAVGAAERPALGTSARVVVWPPANLVPALAAADAEIEALDEQASRFRADSEISRIHRAGGGAFLLSSGLAEAVALALAAARWTSGLVDPTAGRAVAALGYDRDFAAVRDDARPASPARVPGWRTVRLAGPVLSLPAGIWLDLGATAKGLGADRAAAAALAACGGVGGVLVSLGGDVAVAGRPPAGGWPVLIADDHRQLGRAQPGGPPTQLVRLSGGGLATSSVTVRQWRRGEARLHHIVDPRTGAPAAGPWRTVSVAAGDCATANAAATAAIIAGPAAGAWLAAERLPGRLVAHDGTVRLAGRWPAANGGPLDPPAVRLLRSRSEVSGQAARKRGRPAGGRGEP
jgi:thiamine biosynthesis lipoprotein